MNILQMSVQAGMLTAIIIAIRAVALYKLPRTSFLFLWGMVLLRMLIPFSISTTWSIYNIFGSISPGAVREKADLTDKISVMGDSFAHIRAEVSVGQERISEISLLVVLWLCGAVGLVFLFGTMLIRSRRVLKDADRVEAEPFITEWLAARRTLRPLVVIRSARTASPLALGVLRPYIILPEKMDISDERLVSYVLAHEYIHVRRFDMLWKLLALWAVCIHWFNPMAWVMLILLSRDLELSCDEMVLRYTVGADRAEYAGSLLDMAEQSRSFSLLHIYFGKNAIEERILSIMKYKKTSILSLISASAVIAGTGMVFATSAQAENGHISPEEQDRMANAAETVVDTFTVTSYVDPQDGRTYYSFDNGGSFEALTEEEYEQRFPTPDVEWWSYEEYAAWLENEKKELQSMIGEKGWTGGRGEFVWTQEIVDETIAVYEEILQDMKNGLQVSRSVDGNDEIQLMYNPEDVEIGTSERGLGLSVLLSNGEEKVFGPCETEEELLAEVAPFCEEQVRLGNMEQSEADEIMGRYVK